MDINEIIEKHHENNAGFCRHYLTLYSIVLGMESKMVFEFGSGFSSKAILCALEKTDGKLISCDKNPLSITSHLYDISEDDKKILAKRWRYINKSSKEALKDLTTEVFDVVLHDASHHYKEVFEDLDSIIPRVKKNGIIMIHDTAHPTDNYKLDKSIFMLRDKYDIEFSTLPYGYGLTICRQLDDLGAGKCVIKWRKS
jgi:predicted O-methyltransferase YrrM